MTNLAIGFTGTRYGMSDWQKEKLEEILEGAVEAVETLTGQLERFFIHGACVGADEEAATIAKRLGYTTIAFPSTLERWRSRFVSDVTHAPAAPALRNRKIVTFGDFLIAAPESMSEQRGGTWQTIRLAEKTGLPVYILNFLSGTQVVKWPLREVTS